MCDKKMTEDKGQFQEHALQHIHRAIKRASDWQWQAFKGDVYLFIQVFPFSDEGGDKTRYF